jgi:hypothetical protein
MASAGPAAGRGASTATALASSGWPSGIPAMPKPVRVRRSGCGMPGDRSASGSGARNGRTIACTAHDDEFSSRDRSLASGGADCRRKEGPISSSMVNFITIIVRRSGAMSLKPC